MDGMDACQRATLQLLPLSESASTSCPRGRSQNTTQLASLLVLFFSTPTVSSSVAVDSTFYHFSFLRTNGNFVIEA
jgi:hypothetical protein